MKRLEISSLSACLLLAFGCLTALRAEPVAPAPDVMQVYNLLREHITGVSESELNRKAVKALLDSVGSKAALTSGKLDTVEPGPLLKQTNLFDGPILYLRLGKVTPGLAPAVESVLKAYAATNRLDGLVLDLRYVRGTDYAAAAAVADLFQSKARPLLDWGAGVVASKEKTDAFGLPVAVLVNRQTAAAAEALAAVLRQTGVGLILGDQTAGLAAVGTEYPLTNGQQLWIASKPVLLGDGTGIGLDGVHPDIEVQVDAQAERAYYDDAFNLLASTNLNVAGSASGTNANPAAARPGRRTRFGEAELVRGHREGFDPDAERAGSVETEPQVVRDPVLARALDVLKGLAVVRNTRR